MGEVYRARDTRINRDVALKVVSDLLASDGDRLARFKREAQLLASLNHPNIAQLYGFDDTIVAEGLAAGSATHALVMELVEGPTLADRIAAGAVPWREALTIARQIADAIDAAHEQGIVHRDLKPANVKVREAVRNGRQLFTQRVGSSTPVLVYESAEDPKWLDDWSPDGRFLLYHTPVPGRLVAVPLEEPRTPIVLLESPETIDEAHFSPDTRWVAYQIRESGTFQVWVASFPAFEHRRRVSPQGGTQPFWRGDGRELFYLTPTGTLMAVRVQPDAATGALETSAPVELFQAPVASITMRIDQYSVTKDGQRFLFIRRDDTPNANRPINVVVNWTADLFAGR